jgi:two-component system, response regulator PdtaR
MSMKSALPPALVHQLPSWSPYKGRAHFASDEGARPQARTLEPHRILIVEDDLLVAAQIEGTLIEGGLEVVGIATTAEEALELAGRNQPELAVVDIRIAGSSDGVDTAIELFRLHGIRCVFASAFSDQEARQRAEAAAPLGWVQKPYSMALLSQAVRTALDQLRNEKGR